MITAVVPTSPIPAHPDTGILEETLDSIRGHLPDTEIVLTFDGVRPEQQDRKPDYEEYVRRALWLADKKYGQVCPLVFDQHLHQTGMMRAALPEVRTPLLLYVEHDTPLVDELINWGAITDFIMSGCSNVVRLHHEAVIPDAHQHMMHGTEGVEFLRTSQWSQRPHIASLVYYQKVMDAHFSPNACSFIEDKMHGVLDEAFNIDGMAGWDRHRVHIYAPPGSMKRSYHLDGRAGGAKFDDSQVF